MLTITDKFWFDQGVSFLNEKTRDNKSSNVWLQQVDASSIVWHLAKCNVSSCTVQGRKMLRWYVLPTCTLQVSWWIPFGPLGSDKGPLQQTLQSNQSCFGWERWTVSSMSWPAHSWAEWHTSCQVTGCLHWPIAQNTWKAFVWWRTSEQRHHN